jgi:hypothetical protein
MVRKELDISVENTTSIFRVEQQARNRWQADPFSELEIVTTCKVVSFICTAVSTSNVNLNVKFLSEISFEGSKYVCLVVGRGLQYGISVLVVF